MSEEKQHAGFKVGKTAWEDAKAQTEHGEMSDELRRTVHRIAYGEELTKREQLNEHIRDLRDDLADLKKDRRRIDDDIEDVQRQIDRAEEQREALRDKDAEYQGQLDAIESSLLDGVRIKKSNPMVRKAARHGDKQPSDVIAELMERNPEVPEEAFRESKPSEPNRWKEPDTVELSDAYL